MNGKKRKMHHKIDIDTEKPLKGWEGFVCQNCNKFYRRMPLQGICECGGELLISYQGSVSKKLVNKDP